MTRRAAVLFALCLAALDCGVRADRPPAESGTTTPTPEGPTPAADSLIEKASTPEERADLQKARDEVDAEMREQARALDAEIDRLRKENEDLKKKKGSELH